MVEAEDVRYALQLLARVPPEYALLYDDWIKVGMALHSVDSGPEMLEAWDAWSRYAPEKHRAGECASKWRSFKNDGGVTIGTLAHYAGSQMKQQRTTKRRKQEAVDLIDRSSSLKAWESDEERVQRFHELAAAADDLEALELLKQDYGIEQQDVPDDWRVFQHPTHGKGIVYRGSFGKSDPVYKFKSLKRGSDGKRRVFSLGGESRYHYLPQDSPTLVVVGGEEKGYVAHLAGYAVLVGMFGENRVPSEIAEWICSGDFTRVIFANDAGKHGTDINKKSAKTLKNAGYPASKIGTVCWGEDADDGRDLNDTWKTEGAAGLCRLIEGAQFLEVPLFRPLSSVKVEKVEWLWEPWIPLGRVTLLEGDPGIGKTTLLLDLAARLSAGSRPPLEGKGYEGAAEAAYFTLEDSASETLLPRLLAHGGDPEAVYWSEATIRLPTAIETLGEQLRQRGIRLVVFDPLSSFVGQNLSLNHEQDARTVLDPLARLARQLGLSIVLIRHWRKSETFDPLHRGLGSIGIMAAARTALIVANHPTERETKVLAVAKSNAGKKPRSLQFRTTPAAINTPEAVRIETVRIEWIGPCDLTAEDLLIPKAPKARPALDQAKSFLAQELSNGPQPNAEIRAKSEEACISVKTLSRAKEELGVISEKTGGRGAGWIWRLPSPETPHIEENGHL